MQTKLSIALVVWFTVSLPGFAADEPLPGTQPLTIEGDLASRMIEGIDRFLLRELDASTARRRAYWDYDRSSSSAYEASVSQNREQLVTILGMRDPRVDSPSPQILAAGGETSNVVGRSPSFDAFAVRWPAFAQVSGEGLLLVPRNRPPVADVVAIPDADQLPEQIAGLTPGVQRESQFARRLAERGCRVLIPTLISRELQQRSPRGQQRAVTLTNREYLYRAAFELGRHLLGYEVQKVRSGIDWFHGDAQDRPIGVVGYGEGGAIALYTSAIDVRIDAACVSGYFGSRQQTWQEPLDRNVFGLLERFGDAEIASLVAPRVLVIDGGRGPSVDLPGAGGGPAMLRPQTDVGYRSELARLREMVGDVPLPNSSSPAIDRWRLDEQSVEAICRDESLDHFVTGLTATPVVAAAAAPIEVLQPQFATADRQARQIAEIDRHNQEVLRVSSYARAEFMKRLDSSSVEAHAGSVEWYRDYFRSEVIGEFDLPMQAANPRSRLVYEEADWTGYEVVLDVFPDVFAYGVLCVPRAIAEGERRPVVVCQHGLEGRPQDVVAGDHRAYHDFAAKLAERGFVTFAPQNIYIFRDRFRTLQRKANPIKKTLFSIMVPQHQQIVDWLKAQPFVDPERIAFYGLSYGGKSAMRIPPLVEDYCLAICSADFNDWVRKCASNLARYSYVFTGEYEIFEWDLGSTFNYAEMAALIAPRPFMVERGHFDGVAPDEWVAYEYARVRNLYQAQLGIGDRTEIEWFVGPHTINGKGTFDFLHRHLNWPQPE